MTVISVNRKNENKSSSDIINSKVNIVIVGTLNFPRGSASTSRVTAYGKGIIENGGNVTIICLKPIGIRAAGDKEIPPVGVVNGCKYLYPSGITIRPESFIKRKYFEIKGFLNLLGIIWKLNHSHRIDTILYYGYDVFNQFLLAIWTHLLQIPIIEERCEYPFFDQSTMIRKLRAFIYEKFVIRFFDGMLIMTRALENRYRPLMRKSAKYIMVPILVDISRFENISNSDIYEKYIAYCGDPSGNKDGVPILIEAFSLIAQKHPDVKLYIIGGSHRRDVLPSLREKAEKLNIGDRVVFTGKVNPEEMPKYLCNAAVLALARPTSLQAQYGFPTKLGEYLATGRPVVVTDVGEIGKFLRDGENAYIVQPNNAEAFAAKLDYVLANYETAKRVGSKGKETAIVNFDCHTHGKRIVDFIRTLKS